MRLWLTISCLVIGGYGSNTNTTEKLQLQSIIITYTAPPTTSQPQSTTTEDVTTATATITTAPPIPTISCSNVKSVKFCNGNIPYICVGTIIENVSTTMALIITDPKGTVNFIKSATWTVTFDNDHSVSQTFTPSNDENIPKNTDNTSKQISSIDLTAKASYMHILSKTEKNSNTQAVVVAVLEGLIILAIIVVFAYKECFAKNKRRPPTSFSNPTGTASYNANPYGTTGNGVSFGAGTGATNGGGGGGSAYYDNAAELYRQGNTGNATTMRNEGYGYDQQINRSTPATTSPNRIQAETPALVPVSLGSDPLNEWGDQRSTDPFR